MKNRTVHIAISGKGGTGKSTLAALLIRWLNRHGQKSLLAVDADPNVNLNDLLGVPAGEPIGAIREEMKEKVHHLPGGMSKQQFLEHKVHQSLVEKENYDLIVMGRPEGAGCYCYANGLLRDILKTLSENYAFVIIDNEAGMEHLSRRNTQNMDHLIIVSDHSVRGVQAAGRINRLLKELDARVGSRHLVLNRVQGGVSAAVQEQIEAERLDLSLVLPEDETIRRQDAAGKPVYELTEDTPYWRALDPFLSNLIRL